MPANLFDLSGRVAIVTGASRGIGLAIAQAYARAGASIVLSSRKQDALDLAAAGIRAQGGEASAIAAHNGDKQALVALVAQTVARYGRLDILVNNAATNPHHGPLLAAQDSHWQKTLAVNLMGAVWLCQAALEPMRAAGGGKIINIASILGIHPGYMQGIYSITKSAIISLTATLASELGADNIQVNAIAPGLVRTDFARALWQDERLLQRILARTPAGRIGSPEDIAGLALYYASAASDFCSGAVTVLDGGFSSNSL